MTGSEDTRWGCSFLQGPGATCLPVLCPYEVSSRDPPLSVTPPHSGNTEVDRCVGAQFTSCGPWQTEAHLQASCLGKLMVFLLGKKRLEVTTWNGHIL